MAVCALAQEGPPARQASPPRPAGRRGGFNTRDFLGLGRAPDSAAAERGEKLYGPNCAFCHGAKANGAEGPDLVRSAVVLHDEKGELVGPVILKGRPDKGMPAFSNLTAGQAADIAEFLHMRVELAVNRGLYKVQNVVTGNPKAGEAYFNGAGRCNTCHSTSGDLAKVGSRFEPADLQAALLYPGSAFRFDGGGNAKPAVTKVTVTLPSGKSISGALKRMDDFDVSMYDASGQYHSWPRASVKLEVEDRLKVHREMLDSYSDADVHNLLAYLVTFK